MSQQTPDVKLFTPSDMAYTCHNEGVCCRVFDTIPLDEAGTAALRELDSHELNRLAGNSLDAPVTEANAAGPPERKIARKECGECSMLTAANLCSIHAVAGEAAKPKVCQDFPWRYVETPDGVYVGLSFVCPTVRANRGRPVREKATELRDHYQRAASVREAPSLVPLNGRIVLEWADYMAMESALRDLLMRDGIPLSQRMIGFCMVTGFVDQMLTQLYTAEGSSKNLCVPGAVVEITQAMRRSDYEHIWRVARKPTPPADRARRMFLGMFTSFANSLHTRKNGRLSTVAGVMGQYVRHAAGFGRIELQPVSARLARSDLDAAVIPDGGYAAKQITRYVEHCLWRKDLVLSGDLTRRVRLLALNVALIPWYAQAGAQAADRPSPLDSDWDDAIGNVERLYGFHSAFYRFFEQNKVFSDIVDSFILKPGYPFALFATNDARRQIHDGL